MSAASRAAWSVALVGFVVGVLVCGGLIAQEGGDPLALAALGEEDTQTTPHVVDVFDREVPMRPSIGHDGRFFLLQALDPLYVSTEHIQYADRPVYRGQRMLYPLIAGLGGLAPTQAVPWLMGLTQVIALTLGTYATSRLAQHMGARPALGLAFALSPAVLGEIGIGGAGVVALAAAMWATVHLEEGRIGRAAAWFAAAALAREVMLLYVAGACLVRLVRTRRIPWVLGLVPAGAVAAWGMYLRVRLDSGTGADEVREFSAPFVGFVDAWSWWTDDSAFAWLMRALVIAALVAGVVVARRAPSALTVGSVGFVALATVLSVHVWREWFDIARAVLPVFTTVALVLGADAARRREPATDDGSWERPPVPIGR